MDLGMLKGHFLKLHLQHSSYQFFAQAEIDHSAAIQA
jgi:hypothetical protein